MATDKSHITNKNQREILHIKQEATYSLDPDSELIKLFKGEKDGNSSQLIPSHFYFYKRSVWPLCWITVILFKCVYVTQKTTISMGRNFHICSKECVITAPSQTLVQKLQL